MSDIDTSDLPCGVFSTEYLELNCPHGPEDVCSLIPFCFFSSDNVRIPSQATSGARIEASSQSDIPPKTNTPCRDATVTGREARKYMTGETPILSRNKKVRKIELKFGGHTLREGYH